MTGMLASVKNLEEIELLLNENVDIVDLKQPEFGALGALSVELVSKIVQKIDRRFVISATVGDLPMDAEIIFEAVSKMAGAGVDFVKIGFFPNSDWTPVIKKLAEITPKSKLIAVLFADAQPDFSVISEFKNANFSGVMLDTMNKKNGSLTQIMANETISQFITLAKNHSLLCGLAGSLRLEHIAELLPFDADYLGFRGALCHEHNRIDKLSLSAVQKIRQSIVR